MLQTSARLLRLLALLQARRFWSGSDLAERLEVTARTVRRDVDRLRSLGYPVQAAPGTAGGYQLGAGAVLPPLLLEDDEAMAVSIALGTAARSTVTGIEEAALRALVKLEKILPPRLRRRVNGLRAAIVQLPPSGPAVDPAALAALAGACQDRLELRFRYADREARSSERSVEPHGLVHAGQHWYLVAWDAGRRDWRTFRVDRIQGAVALGARFLPRSTPEGGDLRKYVARSVSSAPYAVRARIVLDAPLGELARRLPPSAGVLEPIDDRRCRFDTGAQSPEMLLLWVACLGVEFQIEEPPELAAHLRELHARLGRTLAAGGRRPRSVSSARSPSPRRRRGSRAARAGAR